MLEYLTVQPVRGTHGAIDYALLKLAMGRAPSEHPGSSAYPPMFLSAEVARELLSEIDSRMTDARSRARYEKIRVWMPQGLLLNETSQDQVQNELALAQTIIGFSLNGEENDSDHPWSLTFDLESELSREPFPRNPKLEGEGLHLYSFGKDLAMAFNISHYERMLAKISKDLNRIFQK